MRGRKLGLRTRLRWLRNRARRPGGQAVILMYHRIADDPMDPWGNCVSPENFEGHLAVLRDIARPTRLADLVEGLRAGTLWDGTVCVTFDDGYADNLEVARPLLERYGIPATLFATTGRDGRDREFWWDRLARALGVGADQGEDLELDLAGETRRWTVTAGSRRDIGRELHESLLPLSPAAREPVLRDLAAWAGFDPDNVRPTHRAMEPGELGQMAEGDLVDVEAHTVNHPALSLLPPEDQARELMDSRAQVGDWVGLPARGVSYPHGRVGEVTRRLAGEAGYTYACCSAEAPVRSDSDCFMLPRAYIADSTAETFARRVKWLLY
ncbi:polysaccharide deacetylase family protein [soil metagenome]